MDVAISILAGGIGARLWPLSTRDRPKQFAQIVDGGSTFERALHLANSIVDSARIVVHTSAMHTPLALESVLGADLSPGPNMKVFAEATPLGTGLAFACALQSLPDDATLIVLPADHVIANTDDLGAKLQELAQDHSDRLTIFGAAVEYPTSDLGYLMTSGNKVTNFVQYPSMDWIMLNGSKCLWNTGIYAASAGVWRRIIFRAHSNHLLEQAEQMDRQLSFSDPENSVILLPALDGGWSTQGLDPCVVIPACRGGEADMVLISGWADIGTYAGLRSLTGKKMFAAGVEALSPGVNAVVAASPEGVIAFDEEAIDKGRLANLICRGAVQAHRTQNELTVRSWGFYEVLQGHPHLKVKKLTIFPNCATHLQRHGSRHEHLFVKSGIVSLRTDDDIVDLDAGSYAFIPCGMIHKIGNETAGLVEIIEIQSWHEPDRLLESDIEYLDEPQGHEAAAEEASEGRR